LSNSKNKKVDTFKKEIQVSKNDKTWDFYKLSAVDLDKIFGEPMSNSTNIPQSDAEEYDRCLLLQKNLQDWLNKIGFLSSETHKLTAEERAFLTGGWLEEWTYHQSQELNPDLTEAFIGINPKIEKVVDGKETEFDVVMVKNSHLKVVECKTSVRDADGKNKLREYLDKLAARTKDMGLFAISYLVTLQQIDPSERHALEVDYKIKILDRSILASPELRKAAFGEKF
jgi:hypothetical protein